MRRRGFTLIEVSLVLAITALIFIAFIGTVGNSLSAQRYSDAAQNFAEFLRRQYSAVINVQSNGSGNSKQAIYGRLITFSADGTTVYSYDIVGKALSSDELEGYSNINSAFSAVGASVFSENGATGSGCRITGLVNEESYSLTHGAWLETTKSRAGQGSGEIFKGAIVIARSPVSGVVSTLLNKNYNIYSFNFTDITNTSCSAADAQKGKINLSDFSQEQIDFCIASDDQPDANIRRNIRIARYGSNASAVQIYPQDDKDNPCNS